MSSIGKNRPKIELFEFQNWEVYKKSVTMVGICKKITELNNVNIRGFGDQIQRAALSVPLNIAEGFSRFGGKEKLNFFRIAKGSTFECVACLDVLKSLNQIDLNDYDHATKSFSEIGKMLSGLIRSIQERESKRD